jgi:hypothetical protein
MREIAPFRSSLKRTADAAEYCADAGIVARDVRIIIVSAAFCTAKVTSLGQHEEMLNEKET